jgi:hypothetical protein
MCKLPETKKQKQINDLEIGESGYSFPLSMWVDDEGSCFLKIFFPIFQTKTKEASLKITKETNGYIAYIHEVDNYNWIWTHTSLMDSVKTGSYGEVIGFGPIDLKMLSIEQLGQELEVAISNQDYEKAGEITEIMKQKS